MHQSACGTVIGDHARVTQNLQPATFTPEALHQLPPDVALFTGRDAELARLHALLPEGTGGTVVISAIAGTAGVGKTALALRLAHKLTPRFADIQLFVNLHGYDPLQCLSAGQVLDRFLRALGVPPEALPPGVDEQAALYRSLLAGRAALVVLDNASSTEQVLPLLPGSPTCVVLLTSRRRLEALESSVPLDLDIMEPSDALNFLRKLAGAQRVDAEFEAANKIIALCGCLPLALRIAGSRLGARPTWSLSWLAGRLADDRTRLKELKVQDLEVRTSFALSYRHLDTQAAHMFRHLGLIAGPDFTAGEAAVLCDSTPEQAEDLLECLVDAHLLEAAVTPGRYRFHDLLRLYSRERVEAEEAECDRQAAVRDLLAWYLDRARGAALLLDPGRRLLPRDEESEWPESCFAAHAEALAWLEAERANLVAAVHQATVSGLHAAAWQLSNALVSFFYLRKHWDDWQETHRIGLGAARAAHDRRAESWILTSLGAAFRDLRRFEEATDYQRQALAICREVGDRWGEGIALTYLGATYNNLRQPEEAIFCHQKALSIFREIGYRRGEGIALHNLGEACRMLERTAEAIHYGHQALAICQEIDNPHYEGMVLNNMGAAYRELGRLDDAIGCLEQALKIHRDVGSRWCEGQALQFLGLAFAHMQRRDEARACWREAIKIFTELRAPEANDVPHATEVVADQRLFSDALGGCEEDGVGPRLNEARSSEVSHP